MRLVVSPGPHVRKKRTVAGLHLDWLLALVPALIFSIYTYGWHAVRVLACAVVVSIISETLILRLFKRKNAVGDLSAITTGVLLAMILPPTVPYWLISVAAFSGIFIGKQVFGGLGCNPLNPALVGWAMTRISWPEFFKLDNVIVNYDLGYSLRDPLQLLKTSGVASIDHLDKLSLFFGQYVGGLGSTPTLLILLGGIYLLIRKAISWRIPTMFLLGTVVMAVLFYLINPIVYACPVFHLVAGNVMIGAFFLSTEYGSSPSKPLPMALYGLGCGMLAILLRTLSVYPDAVIFAVLIMGLVGPLLDRIEKKPNKANLLNISESSVL